MEKLKQWDQALLKRSQDAYLWLFDRTGIYAGTVGIVIFLFSKMVEYSSGEEKFGAMAVICVGLNGANCIYRCVLQNSEKYELYNAIVRHWSESTFRAVICVMFLTVCLMGLASANYFSAVSSLIDIFFFNFALAWQIRKREPPEKLMFAHQGSRS